MTGQHLRLRYLRALVAHALTRHQHSGWRPMITNQGRDVDKPSVFLEAEVGGHSYTITITEDR